MIIVKKGNVELRIDEQDVGKYFELGYDVIDKDGRITQLGKKESLDAIMKENDAIRAENIRLKTDVDTLKTLLASTKSHRGKGGSKS